LKCFFEYAAESGYSIPEIQWPKICIHKDKNIPQYYTAEEIKAILGAVDRANPLGKRDYAILMLAAHCGFRAGDIKELEFSDIDFENCQINITQEKTQKPLSTYLLPDVGWALIDYLQNGRPQSDSPKIFITHITPYESFVQSSALSFIIKKYAAAANVRGKKEQKNSFHMLRYSLASDLLKQDVPLTTISGILGHSGLNITSTYTRLDFNQLKSCALEVPV
jgi:integrase